MGRKASRDFPNLEKTIKQPPSGLNKKQAEFIDAIHHKEMSIVLGPAGTGKTFLAAAYAAYYYKLGKVRKIVLTRPTVPTGKSIGFFPGTLEEKMEPWTVPIMEVLTEYLGKGVIETGLKNKNIEVVPFETIRGRTFEEAFIILDEAQNCTEMELKAFLTRPGKNSTTIINGDISQSDLNTSSGLETVLYLLKQGGELQDKVALIEFTSDEVVRSGICQLWVKAFEDFNKYGKNKNSQ